MKRIIAGMLVAMTMVLFGCGGGSSSTPTGGSSSTPTGGSVVTKGIVYPVVVGLSYQTSSGSGVVASDGSYSYKGNENVTFSAGGIELATVPATTKVTPLPLDNDVASTNLLRLLKALDSDGDISNGISLSQMATSTLTSVDLTSEASVVAALASLKPSASLPATNDAQVATVLTNTKATALQNMGTYGSTYRAISVSASTLSGLPKDAVVNLTSQPNWTTGAVTGTAVLTLNDNSTITLPINSAKGNYTASGSTFAYTFYQVFGAKSRVIQLIVVSASQSSAGMYLRDNSQPNMLPVPSATCEVAINTSYTTNYTTGTATPNGPDVYTYTSIPLKGLGSGIHPVGYSADPDGFVVSQAWTSSKGKTGTDNTFSESFYYNEKGSITLTVTDDEGATASKTWQHNPAGTGSGNTTASMLTLSAPYRPGGTSSLALNYSKSDDFSHPSTGFGAHLINNTDILDTDNSYTSYDRVWLTAEGLAPDVDELRITVDVESTGVTVLYIRGSDIYDNGGNSYEFGLNGFNSSFNGGCLVNSSQASPSCASVGISLDRSTGKITFTNTPVVKRVRTPTNLISSTGTLTINGTLTFTPL